jgi:hypothetical protein
MESGNIREVKMGRCVVHNGTGMHIFENGVEITDGLKLRKQIQRLREITGAGVLDCKRAIEQTSNMDDAIQYIKDLSRAI